MIKDLCQKLVEPLLRQAEGAQLDGLTGLLGLWGQLGIDAYEGARPNAWIGEFFPTEICAIFDLNPIHAEGLICLLVMEGMGSDITARGVDYTHSLHHQEADQPFGMDGVEIEDRADLGGEELSDPGIGPCPFIGIDSQLPPQA